MLIAETLSTEIRLPRRRSLTRPDGSIDFRACLAEARGFRQRLETSLAYALRQPRKTTTADIRQIVSRVGELVARENAAWANLPPLIRSAAILFDSLMDTLGTECTDCLSRADAVQAIAANRPAVWDTYRRSPQNQFVDFINGGVNRQCYDASQETVFEALVHQSFRNPNFLNTLVGLNAAGDAVIRNARAARALRSGTRTAA
jgi:hypothetical protein